MLLRIAPSGDVDGVRFPLNGGLSSDVTACIAAVAARAHFAPPGPSGTTMSIPFKFERLGDPQVDAGVD